jgi:hypothetical protein
VEKDPKKKDDPEKILQKKGKNVVVLKSELLPVEGGSALPDVMILAKLDPFEQPEISFTALEMDPAEDVKIQLRYVTKEIQNLIVYFNLNILLSK